MTSGRWGRRRPLAKPAGPAWRGSSKNRGVRIAVLSVVAAIVILLLDSTGGSHSPLSPVRNVIGTIAGPFEKAAHAVVSPVVDLGGYLHSNRSLRAEINRLKQENAHLQGQAALTQLQQSRIAEVDALTGLAKSTGYTLLTAHVIALGPAQSFARTATLDAGTSAGVHEDMTVVDSGGLVGRVVSVTPNTATVLLITDPTSVVGGRLGTNLELGTVTGRGTASAGNDLSFSFSDAAVLSPGGSVTTWGSPDGIPYVAGIPIGSVVSTSSNARNLSATAVLKPFARLGALDIVGVVVPPTTSTSRPLIHGVG